MHPSTKQPTLQLNVAGVYVILLNSFFARTDMLVLCAATYARGIFFLLDIQVRKYEIHHRDRRRLTRLFDIPPNKWIEKPNYMDCIYVRLLFIGTLQVVSGLKQCSGSSWISIVCQYSGGQGCRMNVNCTLL